MASENFLDYTGLTYEDIVQQVTDTLAGDPRFENFRESAIAKTLIEIFAACTDLSNHYLERRAEENYLDTAKLKSSIILLSRMIGYVPVRPVPAKTSIKMILEGPLPGGLTTSDSIILSAGTTFDYNGTPFRLNKTYIYNFTASDLSLGTDPDFTKEIQYSLNVDTENLALVTNPDTSAVSMGLVKTIDLIQGEIVSTTILGSTNSLVGQIFQRYKIDDATASNYYGQEDLGYDVEDDSFNYESNLTRVIVGSREFRIDRRSLFNNKTIFDFNTTSATENMCVMKSSIDEGLEIVFGDDKYAAIGPRTRSDDIVVSYFSTLGENANKTGVAGDIIQTNSQFTSNSIPLTPNISFKLTKNITAGADFESVDSIRYNAPNIFYSLDRLVSTTDYISYLKTLTSPINVKNAVAWGEQEEGQGTAIKKLANVVLFSVLGELYKKDPTTKNWNVKTVSGSPSISDAMLEGTAELDTNYFNILIKESVVDELRLYTSATTGYEDINTVVNAMNKKSQLTVRNVYLKPIIQDFDLPLVVYAKKLSDLNNTKIAVKNKVYAFLNEEADFDKPVYKSNIIELVESVPQVSHVDFHIEPDQSNVGPGFDMYTIPAMEETPDTLTAISAVDIVSWYNTWGVSMFGAYQLQELSDIYVAAINEYITSGVYTNRVITVDSNYLFTYSSIPDTMMYSDTLSYLDGVTERTFYNNFIKNLYDSLVYYELNTVGIPENEIDYRFSQSENFLSTVTRLHNSFSYIIKYNMLNNENVQNFSLNNEIAKFSLENMNVIYV